MGGAARAVNRSIVRGERVPSWSIEPQWRVRVSAGCQRSRVASALLLPFPMRSGSALAPSTPSLGVIDGRYQLEAELGRGAQAVVYRAYDPLRDRWVALKLLQPHGSAKRMERSRIRFRREFHTLLSLRHPNIVEVCDFGLDRRGAFYTMELLSSCFERGDDIPLEQLCRVLLDLASALAFLHARRMVHGDISRRNVGLARGVAKLMDFGLLSTVGDLGRGCGTPPYLAPEVAWGAPLDHRTDLFSLGALAYGLLTGRHAFPARTSIELEPLWSQPPPPPALLNPEVPAALSELVVSMLSIDPLGRPASAAEVIDRIGALAGPERTRVEVNRGYLASARLAGRERELERARGALRRTRSGEGEALLLEAPSGMGKSRLLREIAVEAQLGGARVLSARCEGAGQGPYSALHGLLEGLLRTLPTSIVTRATRATSAALAALSAWVGEPRLLEPGGDRGRLQALLVRRVIAAAEEQALVLLVDDLQRCDEASLAVLASLAHQAERHPLLLVGTVRSDEPVVAPLALATLRQAATTLHVEALGRDEVQELMQAVFGDVDNVARLAAWLHQVCAGVPLRCTELARHLVESGKIRYQDGVWRIPERLEEEALPGELKAAIAERLARLRPEALALAQALALHPGELRLDFCVALAECDEPAAFAALDELVEQEILIGSTDRLRFRHDSQREVLLAGLEPARARALHLRIGQLLERAGEGGDEEIGWHLLRGGERVRGAERLASAGERAFDAQAYAESIAPLEAALEVFEETGAPHRRVLDLRVNLVRAGLICDRAVVLRHAERAIDALARHAGVSTLERLRPFLGRFLAGLFALVVATVRWALSRGANRGPAPLTALTLYIAMVNYLGATRGLELDLDGIDVAHARLAALPPLNPSLVAIRSFSRNLRNALTGRWVEAARLSKLYLRNLESLRRWSPHPLDFHLGIGAMHYILAIVTSHREGPRCLDLLAELERSDLRFVEISAKVGRLIYHRFRGEEPIAERTEAEIRLLMVQLGSMWLWQSQMIWISAIGHCLTGNLPGLRRTIDELERWVDGGVHAGHILALARGVYHAQRGELDAAAAQIELALAHPGCARSPLFQQSALLLQARTLLARREHASAARAAREAIALAGDPTVGIHQIEVLALCVLAIAEARRGEHASLAALLPRMASLLERSDGNPFLCGSLHEAWATIHHHLGDEALARHHLELCGSHFRASGNAALCARVETLAADLYHRRRGPELTLCGSSQLDTEVRETA